ncbi:hypothetical protein LAX5112_04957 [Roseibium alexandrii]|uniref:Uncharacterized protein n=1 Tax=Roseibium alexandrii TaxID=388408 RepID=A0A0M7AST7_9HYPH|nr:hypothetical protein LAX5112_04957 [Roseibium alexandrii]
MQGTLCFCPCISHSGLSDGQRDGGSGGHVETAGEVILYELHLKIVRVPNRDAI